MQLGYVKDGNAAAHSVDSDIFYAEVLLPTYTKTYTNLYFLR